MNKKHFKMAIKIFFVMLLLVLGLVFLSYGILNKKYIDITYKENKSINYKVYLKENKYFEKEYLEENRTYIASLINYLDINFRYIIDFDEPVNGEYSYYIKASLYANKSNNEGGYYWYKDYDLTNKEVVNLNNSKSFIIDRNINIDYSKYNRILNEFKKEYSMQTDGELKVSLIVESNVSGKEYKKEIDLSSEESISIPLLLHTVDISIEKSVDSETKTLSYEDDSSKTVNNTFIAIGSIVSLISVFLLLFLVIQVIIKNKKNAYRTLLRKILNNHDSIIVNADFASLPNTDDYDVIKVTSFDELLDVYNEVRMPINYYQNKSIESIFMIINDGVIWEYRLKKEEVEKNRK
ncbi:MAG: hypothetical protein IJ568_00820 [Bacilli bacterium]|nr:hypothetical protein [Bacilli bacterium]